MIQVCIVIVLGLEAFATVMLEGKPCVTPYQEEGICVQSSKCPVILMAFDTVPNQAIELWKESQCGCDAGKVCCGSSINAKYPLISQCSAPLIGNITIAPISDPSICGLDQFVTIRIQGGEEADFGEFSWLVAIESKSKFNNDSAAIRCGGSIITDQYILTAAHCIAHPEFVATRVWLGATNISPEGNCLNVTGKLQCIDSIKKMNIEKTFPHPGYQSFEKINDIGLVRVDSVIEYSEYIRPICLPSPNSPTPAVGTYMTVAGWGSMEQEGTGSDIKLKVRLPVKRSTMCNTFLGRQTIEEQLCVGGEQGKDSCQGDSGGPLMKDFINENGDGQWYQEGIVSYGSGCGSKGRPAVYTRVSSYIRWISNTINNQKFDLEKGDPCSTPNGNDGTCVPLTTCEEIFKKVATKNENGYTFARNSRCGYDNETLVCCESPGSIILPNFNSTALPNKTICGVVKDKPRVYGGEVADLGEFPWVVAIEFTSKRTNKSGGILCAGSVINTRYVLTTANGLVDKAYEPKTVWIGDWNITSDLDCKELSANVECADEVQKIPVKKVIPHLYYDRVQKQNNIGLIWLESEFQFSAYVGPICLPPPSLALLNLGTSMTIVGWGKTENHDHPDSDVLRYVQIPMVTNEKCNKIFERARFKIGLQQICAGGGKGKGSCLGDGGAPLVRIYEDKANGGMQWYQEGLTSYGFWCGYEGRPAIYTRVSSYTNWIINIISED